jgi:hypothetical protein
MTISTSSSFSLQIMANLGDIFPKKSFEQNGSLFICWQAAIYLATKITLTATTYPIPMSQIEVL